MWRTYTSEYFQTDTGVPQGDYMGANEFMLYLAKSPNNNTDYERLRRNTPTRNKSTTTKPILTVCEGNTGKY